MASKGETPDGVQLEWDPGTYEQIAPRYLGMAGELVAHAPIEEGTAVLDVGCGPGSVTIPAARTGADPTGVDIHPGMIEVARANAETAGFEGIEWRTADATALPFPDDRFEVTLSNLGHMHADPPEHASRELFRVTGPDGHLGFTSWTPSSVYPTLAQTMLPYLATEDLPELTAPPFMWGDPDVVTDRLGSRISDLEFETGSIRYPALSPPHFLEATLEQSDVFSGLFDRVDPAERASLRSELQDRIEVAFDARENAVELEYLRTSGRVA